MNTSEIFDFNRLAHLIINDIKVHFKTILIAAAIFVLIFFLTSFTFASSSHAYFFSLYTIGFIISSTAFNDLHQLFKTQNFLTLPCSNLERFLNKWLLTSLGFSLVLLLFFYMSSLLGVILNLVISRHTINPLDIQDPQLWFGIGKYIILQSIVFLGAIVFKKNSLIKTALTLGCFFILLNLFYFSVTSLFCVGCIGQGWLLYSLFKGEYFIFWSLAAPCCWYMTYLRLKNYELK